MASTAMLQFTFAALFWSN